jgi:hypothetical protein
MCHSERAERVKPALSTVEGNLVPQAKNGMLREVYPELVEGLSVTGKVLSYFGVPLCDFSAFR